MTNTTSTKAYDIRSCQTKTLAVRILQGYEITKTKCTNCGVPLMEYKGKASCVICPQVLDSAVEGEEDGGVEIINNLLSGSMLGSMSSSVNSRQQGGRRQSGELLDISHRSPNADTMKSSYSIESEEDYVPFNKADESSSVDEPSVAAAQAESVAKSEQEEMTASLANEAEKDSVKNALFMKKIGEMAQTAKKKKGHQALNINHVSFSQKPPAFQSPSDAKINARQSQSPMRACESPKTATKRMSINNIAGDESAKRCYMPAWESKMNSVTKEDLEGKIKTMASTDKEVESYVEKTSDESRDDGFFSELRQKAANKPKVDPFPRYALDDADDSPTRDLRTALARPETFASKEDVVEKELKLQQQLWRRANMRKMEEKEMEKSMTNYRQNTPRFSRIPTDEMKALAVMSMKKEKLPEPFDENELPNDEVQFQGDEEAEQESEESVLASTEELLKSSHKVLGDTKRHLSNKKKHNQIPSSSDSIDDSMKEHSKRIVALEAKSLRKYSNAALAATNPNPSSDSLKSLSTTEKDKRQMLRSRVVELEAEALRKHSEAALAALHARQALDKMMEIRKKKHYGDKSKGKGEKLNDDKKQSKIEDLSIGSSLSTKESGESKDETASHQSFSVESASMSQYSGTYEYRQSINDGRGGALAPSRERRSRSTAGRDINTPELNVRSRTYSSEYHGEERDHPGSREDAQTPPRGRRSRPMAGRDINPPELNVRSRTYSSEYHGEEREHPSRSRSAPRSRMPSNIMLPSLQSPEAMSRQHVHHASPRHSRDIPPSRPHLLPYSPPRTTPRKSSRQTSQPTQRPFSHRPYSPSPDLYRNGPYKYHGSMTPRTVHEQQHFDYNENQVASRNYESMMLASNQTVQERMMNQPQPRMVYSNNPAQPAMYYNDQEHLMNRRHQERMINQQQQHRMEISGNYIPEKMVQQQQRPTFHFDPATQSSHLNSPKVQFTHPYETEYDGEANVQYVNNPNVYLQQDNRNDHPSMRYDGTSMRW